RGRGLRQKALELAAVGERERADRERRRNARDEAAERVRPHRPDLDRDGGAAGIDADEPGLRRRARQQEQAIVLRRRALLQKARAEGGELAVERHAGEMRADDGDGDFVIGGTRRYRRERRLRRAGGAERQRSIGMERAAERGERGVLARGRDQRDAEG